MKIYQFNMNNKPVKRKLFEDNITVTQPESLFSKAFVKCLNQGISLEQFNHCSRNIKKEHIDVLEKGYPFEELNLSNTNHYKWFSPDCSTYRNKKVLLVRGLEEITTVEKSLVNDIAFRERREYARRELWPNRRY